MKNEESCVSITSKDLNGILLLILVGTIPLYWLKANNIMTSLMLIILFIHYIWGNNILGKKISGCASILFKGISATWSSIVYLVLAIHLCRFFIKKYIVISIVLVLIYISFALCLQFYEIKKQKRGKEPQNHVKEGIRAVGILIASLVVFGCFIKYADNNIAGLIILAATFMLSILFLGGSKYITIYLIFKSR